MKAISLESTTFQITSEIVNKLPTAMCWVKGKPTQLVDFGTVIVGEVDQVPDFVFSGEPGELRFMVPDHWRLCHVLAALKAFPSVGQARKNGWDKEIPEGMSQFVFRLNKVKGSITTWKARPGG